MKKTTWHAKSKAYALKKMYIYARMTSTSLLLAKKFFVGLLLLHYIEDLSSFCCYLTDL